MWWQCPAGPMTRATARVSRRKRSGAHRSQAASTAPLRPGSLGQASPSDGVAGAPTAQEPTAARADHRPDELAEQPSVVRVRDEEQAPSAVPTPAQVAASAQSHHSVGSDAVDHARQLMEEAGGLALDQRAALAVAAREVLRQALDRATR